MEEEAAAQECERCLATAASMGEGLRLAIAAADWYMKAAEKATTPAERARLGRKFRQIVARGEELKVAAAAAYSEPLSSSLPSPATLRPPPRPTVTGPASSTAAASVPSVPPLQPPTTPTVATTSQQHRFLDSSRQLPKSEQIILLRSSKLHGFVFPPWEQDPDPAQAAGEDPLYSDPATLPLSPAQQRVFEGWKRPQDLFPAYRESSGNLMTTRVPSDLLQDGGTDCSVVASLCAAEPLLLGHSRSKSLLSTLMWPFDHAANRPAVSEKGRYVFRMFFNGCWRQVVIDDRLPASTGHRALFVVDKRNPQLLWPALVEKAYLKVRGGYGFPGSNSATDLHVLTGWIPEQIFLQADDLDMDRVWARIGKAFEAGLAILTLGMGSLSSATEQQWLGLVANHDYAVLSLRWDPDGTRCFFVKNPWCDQLVWTGMGSSSMLQSEEQEKQKKKESGGDNESHDVSNTFWISFEDVRQHFASLYINWDPAALFSHRQDFHLVWELPEPAEEKLTVYTHNPQFVIRAPASTQPEPIWVLLTRHWQRSPEPTGRRRRPPLEDNELGFVSLALLETSPPGTRAPLPPMAGSGVRAVRQGPFVDSASTLLRFSSAAFASAAVPLLTVAVCQGSLPLPLLRYPLTVSFLSTRPLDVGPAPDALPHHAAASGSWTRRTAGGTARDPTYHLNPQFVLTVPAATPLRLVLSVDSRDTPCHVAALFPPSSYAAPSLPPYILSPSSSSSPSPSPSPSPLSDVTAHPRIVAGRPLHPRDVLAASPEYQRGCTSARAPRAEPGRYVVVASTFEPGRLGRFRLRVSADCPVELAPAPRDGAGMLRTPAPGPALLSPLLPGGLDGGTNDTNEDDNSGGGDVGDNVAGQHGPRRLVARVQAERLTRASVLARPLGPSNGHPATASAAGTMSRVALEVGQGAHRTVLAASGDGGAGLASSPLPFNPFNTTTLLHNQAAAAAAVDMLLPDDDRSPGEFSDAALGLRTPEVDLDPARLAERGGLFLVAEQMGGLGGGPGGRHRRQAGGLEVEILSDNPVRIGPWERAGSGDENWTTRLGDLVL